MLAHIIRWVTRRSPGTLLALAMLLLQFGVSATGGYGYFRDEFYYIACSNNMAWGYVDHPPLSILLLWVIRQLLGDSIFAIRFLSAVAAGGFVLLTGTLVREMGGGRTAQFVACLAVFFAPVYLAISSFYSMNVFEPLFWTGSLYLVIRIINSGSQYLWLLFGVLAGLGLQNKHSMLFFGLALVIALLLTPQRTLMTSKWFWMGAMAAAALLVPNLLWQAANDWASLEFMRNAQQWKNSPMSPLEFLSAQILFQHPLAAPTWIVGLASLSFLTPLKKYRFLAIMYVVLIIFFVAQRGKPYYLSPIYPGLFSAGAILIEQVLRLQRWRFLTRAYLGISIAGGVLTIPLWTPILPVNANVKYSRMLGITTPKMERQGDSVLPQVFADRFGWSEMVTRVARAYHSLTPEEQSQTTIYAQNYGEAGAIDFFGRQYRLPKAISGHNSYWLWGVRDSSATTVITIGGKKENHAAIFESVELFLIHSHPYAMSFENNLPIYICRRPKLPLTDIWPKVKHYM